MNQEKGDDCTEFNFTYLRRGLDKDILPSCKWGFNAECTEFCTLQKMEHDFSVRKGMAVLSNMHVNPFRGTFFCCTYSRHEGVYKGFCDR